MRCLFADARPLDLTGLLDELRVRIQADKARKAIVETELLAFAAPAPALDPDRLRATLRSSGTDVRALLEGHVGQARQMLRKLLDGTTLMLEPIVVSGERRYAFSGSGNYLRLLPADLARTVGAPTRFEPVFQSRPRFRQQHRNVLHRAPRRIAT
jgi:hypothetical protein